MKVERVSLYIFVAEDLMIGVLYQLIGYLMLMTLKTKYENYYVKNGTKLRVAIVVLTLTMYERSLYELLRATHDDWIYSFFDYDQAL